MIARPAHPVSGVRLHARPASRRRSSRRAFTLIETVVALMLFTLCAGILLEILAGSKLSLVTGLRGNAIDADRRLIVRTVLAAGDLRTLLRGGKLTASDGAALTWRCTCEPTPTIDLHRITVLLSRETKAGEAADEQTLTLFALRPAWSDPVAREAALAAKKAADPGPYPEMPVR